MKLLHLCLTAASKEMLVALRAMKLLHHTAHIPGQKHPTSAFLIYQNNAGTHFLFFTKFLIRYQRILQFVLLTCQMSGWTILNRLLPGLGLVHPVSLFRFFWFVFLLPGFFSCKHQANKALSLKIVFPKVETDALFICI
ncbi:MAG: hypothetical protein B5M56_02385 [Desulfococcus sp. 4484_241]|nr:MAG: hypothetical protein B5M56_02385 [Desulfococcus sp. 4484_241]